MKHKRTRLPLREIAKKNSQLGAAVSAEVRRGELMGFYVQRRENTNTNYNISDKPMTEKNGRNSTGFELRPVCRAESTEKSASRCQLAATVTA
jgi:hypothetical protein